MQNISVFIIDVAFDTDVAAIIATDVMALTRQNHEMIDNAIASSLEQQRISDQARNRRAAEDAARSTVLSRVYDELAAAATFVTSTTILDLVMPTIPNLLSFVGQMKSWLKSNAPQDTLVPVKAGKERGYRLERRPAPPP